MKANPILDAARRVLEGNLREGFSSRTQSSYCYTCPSMVGMKYPHQWLWDSCFHAIAWAHFDLDQAKRELITLLSAVGGEGFLPHMIVWKRESLLGAWSRRLLFGTEHHNMFTQPPVIATAIERVYQKTGDKPFLEQTLPATLRVYRWLSQSRDIDGDGLVSLITPVESGADQSPVFDRLFRLRKPSTLQLYAALHRNYVLCRILGWDLRKIERWGLFSVEEIGYNSILANDLSALARLLAEVGEEESARWARLWAKKATQSIVDKCLDSKTGLFHSLAFRKEKMIKEPSYASLMPLVLDGLDGGLVKGIVSHLTDEEEFWLAFPVPSVPKNHHAFDLSDKPVIWRGPTWININWFLAQGLRKHGHRELASELERRSLELVERSGFRECYNPLTGDGLRTKNFSWSTLVVDFLT